MTASRGTAPAAPQEETIETQVRRIFAALKPKPGSFIFSILQTMIYRAAEHDPGALELVAARLGLRKVT